MKNPSQPSLTKGRSRGEFPLTPLFCKEGSREIFGIIKIYEKILR
jgi:hypothetical protein